MKWNSNTYWGMFTYMGLFITRLSEHTANVCDLLKKDNIFTWTKSQKKAFKQIKTLISEGITVAYFDPTKPAIIQVDASGRGLGAALLQEGKPVVFASKSLKPTEQRYVNIECEM